MAKSPAGPSRSGVSVGFEESWINCVVVGLSDTTTDSNVEATNVRYQFLKSVFLFDGMMQSTVTIRAYSNRVGDYVWTVLAQGMYMMDF
jgi:hypothetical protein